MLKTKSLIAWGSCFIFHASIFPLTSNDGIKLDFQLSYTIYLVIRQFLLRTLLAIRCNEVQVEKLLLVAR